MCDEHPPRVPASQAGPEIRVETKSSASLVVVTLVTSLVAGRALAAPQHEGAPPAPPASASSSAPTTASSPTATAQPSTSTASPPAPPPAPPSAQAPAAPSSAAPVTAPLPPPAHEAAPAEAPKKEHWYDKLSIRGYAQFRYNRLGNDIDNLIGKENTFDNDKLVNPSQDKSLGSKNGFNFRRARLILSGDVHPRVFVYFQLDAANAVADDKQHFVQIRDLYGDLALDQAREFRFRVGQSKVPFGWENMQSSQNRAPHDRSDAINSAAPGERDIGVFFYWAPEHIRARFKHLVDSGLKGSGDYGVVGVGAYNGQAANIKEGDDSRFVVGRLTWPFEVMGQIIEPGAAFMMGKYYATPKDAAAQGAAKAAAVDDLRANAQLVWYPQPIGFQAELIFGKGAEKVESTTGGVTSASFEARKLAGGYVMVIAKVGPLVPYVRYQWFKGNRKEVDAPHLETQEVEGGLETHFGKHVELTTSYATAKRKIGTEASKAQDGHAIRLQLQLNY